MKALLEWVDRLASAGRSQEEEGFWQVTLPLGTAGPGVVAEAFAGAGIPGAVQVWAGVEGRAVRLDPTDDGTDLQLEDLDWEPGNAPCPVHLSAHGQALARQTRGERFGDRERLRLLEAIARCPQCAVPFTLTARLDKQASLGARAAALGYTLPEEVLVRVWFDRAALRAQYSLPHMLRWPERCVLLAVGWDWELGGRFIRTADLRAPDFWPRLLMACAALQRQTEEELPGVLARRRFLLPAGYTLLPLEYWISGQAVHAGQLAADFARDLHGGALLALGLLAACATRAEAGPDRVTFVADREQPMEVTVQVGPESLSVGGHTLDQSAMERAWLGFYADALRGEKPRGNQAMVQNAIATAGGARLDSLMVDRSRLEAVQTYYKFQYESLLEERFRQHVEISRLYLTQRQEAGARAGAAVNDLYKNLATVLTTVGALAVVVVTAAINSKPENLGNYLVATGAALGVAYVPAYLIWANALIDEHLERLKDLAEQLRWSAETLKFPVKQLGAAGEVGSLARRLLARVRPVMALMLLLQAAALALLWFAYGETANWLRARVAPATFGAGFLGWVVLLIAGQTYLMRRRSQRVKELQSV
jgi:hypothetical protein